MAIQRKKDILAFIESVGIDPNAVKQIDLLDQSLTHKSYAADYATEIAHNERLEFVWDAVLGSAIATLLWTQHPDKSEADMTLYKIALVREETLATVARKMQVNDIVLISKGEDKNWGRDKDAILSDTLEAIIGYITIDIWYEAAYRFVEQRVYREITSISPDTVKSYKTQLQEWIQSRYKTIPSYIESIEAQSPSGNVESYRSDVYLSDNLIGSGSGFSKKKAQEAAAENALKKLIAWQEKGNK